MWEIGYLVLCCVGSFLIGCGFATRHWRNRGMLVGTPSASHNSQMVSVSQIAANMRFLAQRVDIETPEYVASALDLWGRQLHHLA